MGFKVGDECNIRCEVVSVAKDGMEVRPTSSKDALIFCFSDGRFDRKDPIPSLFKRKFKRRVDKVDVEAEAEKAWESTPEKHVDTVDAWFKKGFRACAEVLKGPKKQERVWTLEEIRRAWVFSESKVDSHGNRYSYYTNPNVDYLIKNLLAQKPSEPKPEPVKPERKLKWKAWRHALQWTLELSPVDTQRGVDVWQRVPSLDVYEEGEK